MIPRTPLPHMIEYVKALNETLREKGHKPLSKIQNYPVLALDLPANSFTDGLLGMDFLILVRAVIDVAKGEIRIDS